MPPPRILPFEPSPLWQRARDPIFWLDSALKLMWVNHAWEELTGYTAETVVGLTCHAHGPTRSGDPSDLAASFHPPPESLAGEPAGIVTLILHAGGEGLWRRVEYWPLRDDQDVLIGVLGLVRDANCQPGASDSPASRLRVELLQIRQQLQKETGFDSLIGFGPSHRRLLDQVRLAAGSSTPLLIVGEPGTGKQQVARAIHQNGPARQQPFVPFDCEALPAEILDRELFGVAMPDPSEPGPAPPRPEEADLASRSWKAQPC